MPLARKLIKHVKCRGGFYPRTEIERLTVPDNLIDWSTEWSDYKPAEYNSPILDGKPWADLPIGTEAFQPKWNELDGNVNRKSYHGSYQIVNEYPLNPCGRTGLKGRGVLGKWGPNHAADPIVTRWKRTRNGVISQHPNTKKAILQLCVIQRSDCKEWALPGGMVDPWEKVSLTLKREFMEEAMNSLDKSLSQRMLDEKKITELFSDGTPVYNGYVDDPRNTDNAWMETVAVNFHDDLGTGLGSLELEAGDDASRVKWVDLSQDLKLYASHSEMVKEIVQWLHCHW